MTVREFAYMYGRTVGVYCTLLGNGIGKQDIINDYNTRRYSTSSPPLDLALWPLHQLCRGACDGELTRLLDLGLESNLVTIAPHLSHQSLTGNDTTGESNLDVLEFTETLVDGLSGNAKEAQAVEDRSLETTNLGKGRVDVKRAKSVSHGRNSRT